MAMEYVCLYHSYLDAIQALGDAERGRLLTAMLEYSIQGASGHLSGNERFIWPLMKAQIDRDKASYSDKCRRNSENRRQRPLTTVNDRQRPLTTVNEINQGKGEGEGEGEGEGKGKGKGKGKGEDKGKSEGKGERKQLRAHGQYGWIKLTDAQFAQLLSDFGKTELDRLISYVDEYVQSTGNKRGYRDWNLLLRKAHRDGWGLRGGKQTQANTPVEPTAERIRQNADWLDDFLEKQEGGNDI